MTWYNAYFRDDKGYLQEVAKTFDRKVAFKTAHEAAKQFNKTVIVRAENGMQLRFYDITP